MEAGKTVAIEGIVHDKIDLVDAMVASSNEAVTDEQLDEIERSACPTCGSCSGMFTANSMNCLTEAIGLALPGNGSMLATHVARKGLFEQAGGVVVDLCRRYYERGRRVGPAPQRGQPWPPSRTPSPSTWPWAGPPTRCCTCWPPPGKRSSTSRVADIDRISRQVPCLSKVAPNSPKYHMEDVHRAGGIPAILGELNRAGLLNRGVHAVHSPTLDQWLGDWDIRSGSATEAAMELFHAAPGGVRTTQPFSTTNRWGHARRRRRRGLHPGPGPRLLRRRWPGHPLRQPGP